MMPLTDIPNEANGENRLRKIFLEIYQIQDQWENFLNFLSKSSQKNINWKKYHTFSDNNLDLAVWLQR